MKGEENMGVDCQNRAATNRPLGLSLASTCVVRTSLS